jgi:septal ring factor EnvC (AmiA/AmiB activator)
MSDKPIPLRDAPEPWVAIARRQLRSGFIISTVGYVLVVAVIGWTLVAMERETSIARADLASVAVKLADANGQLSSARAELAQTQQAATQAQAMLADLRKQYDSVTAAKEAAERDLAARAAATSDLRFQAVCRPDQ